MDYSLDTVQWTALLDITNIVLDPVYNEIPNHYHDGFADLKSSNYSQLTN